MVSEFTLLSLLLATVALAVPSSLVKAPITRGHEDRQSRPIGRVASGADAANGSWAGAFAHMNVCIIPRVHDPL